MHEVKALKIEKALLDDNFKNKFNVQGPLKS